MICCVFWAALYRINLPGRRSWKWTTSGNGGLRGCILSLLRSVMKYALNKAPASQNAGEVVAAAHIRIYSGPRCLFCSVQENFESIFTGFHDTATHWNPAVIVCCIYCSYGSPVFRRFFRGSLFMQNHVLDLNNSWHQIIPFHSVTVNFARIYIYIFKSAKYI